MKIIDSLNRRNFDFKFDTFDESSSYSCKGEELSASRQVDLYLIAEYDLDKPEWSEEPDYTLNCQVYDS